MKKSIAEASALRRDMQTKLQMMEPDARKEFQASLTDALELRAEDQLESEKKHIRRMIRMFNGSFALLFVSGAFALVGLPQQGVLKGRLTAAAGLLGLGVLSGAAFSFAQKKGNRDAWALAILANSNRSDEKVKSLMTAFRISEQDINVFNNQAALWEAYEHRDGRS